MSTIIISNIKATGETASRAVSGVAAAFVGYNSWTTTSILVSQNISSLTDNGTGDTTASFSNGFSSATSLCCADTHGTGSATLPTAIYFDGSTITPYSGYSASSIRHLVGHAGGTTSFDDDRYANIMINGDLA